MKIESVYKGRDNTNDFILKADGVAVDLSGVTKMDLVFPAVTISSSNNPGVFDWSDGSGKLILSLGGSLKNPVGGNADLQTGKRFEPSLIVYDADNLSGINWGKINIIFC